MNKKFELWWDENKDDPCLSQEYEAYKQDCTDIEIETMNFQEWCQEFYDESID